MSVFPSPRTPSCGSRQELRATRRRAWPRSELAALLGTMSRIRRSFRRSHSDSPEARRPRRRPPASPRRPQDNLTVGERLPGLFLDCPPGEPSGARVDAYEAGEVDVVASLHCLAEKRRTWSIRSRDHTTHTRRLPRLRPCCPPATSAAPVSGLTPVRMSIRSRLETLTRGSNLGLLSPLDSMGSPELGR